MSKKQKPQDTEKQSIVYWLLTGFVLLFLFWAPFQKALFNGNTYAFERPIYSTVVWSSIILLLLSIFMLFYWKLRDSRDLFSLLIWLLPLSFLISIIPAASHHFAENMLYIQFVYAIFFILGIYLSSNKSGFSLLPTGIMLSAYTIVWFGILNFLGNAHYQDAVMKDSNGFRLASVFQYANSYAGYLVAILLSALFLTTISRKWYAVAFHSFTVVPIIISLFLTLSRGGIVVLPILLLLILPFMKLSRQVFLLIQIVLAAVTSMLILGKVTDIGMQIRQQYTASLSTNGWIILIGASLLYSAIIVLLSTKIEPLIENKLTFAAKHRFSNFILPIGAILVGAIGIYILFGGTKVTQMLPENVRIRVENINLNQHSVLERGTFYKDAMKVFHDYPAFGAGGGAWAALYEKYQNNPYVSRQAHNFFLQYLVETGSVGIVIFILFITAVFYLYIRFFIKNKSDFQESHFIYFIIAVSLLLHSAIDFDLSYVFLGIVLFLCLGGIASGISSSKQFNLRLNNKILHKSYPALLFGLSIIMLFHSGRLLNANTLFQNSVSLAQSQKSYDEIIAPLNQSIELQPGHPDYLLFKIDLLNQAYQQTKGEHFYSESNGLIERLEQKEPYNRMLLERRIQTYDLKKQTSNQLEAIREGLINFPWDISIYEKDIILNFNLGDKARLDKDSQAMNQYWNNALNTYQKILNKTKELELLPKEQLQGRPFNVTKPIADAVGRIYYIRGDYSTAAAVFKQGLNDQFDDQNNRITARWYLAALSKQNSNDQALYDKLVAKDPKEKQEIEQLIHTNFSVR